MQYIGFCSGGKDSTAMIEKIIENKMKLDKIIFVVVEKEFPQETEQRNMLIDRWSKLGYNCISIQTHKRFDDWFFGKNVRGKSKGLRRGFPLQGAFGCYWNREAKYNVITKYLKSLKEDYIEYVGYTIDETSYKRKGIRNRYLNGEITDKIYPLIDWNMTEEDCREFCKERGILNPLYKHFERLGCYLCPNQKKRHLALLKEHYPEQWEELNRYLEATNNDEFVAPGRFNIVLDIDDFKEI